MKRGRRLRADPAKTRAFTDRGREAGAKSLREAALAGARVEQQARAGEGPLSPSDWRVAVATDAGLRCSLTGTRAEHGPFDPAFHAHHFISKEHLRARGLREFVWDRRNGLFLLAALHMDDEAGQPLILRGHVPDRAWGFADDVDNALGSGWATMRLEREYPVSGHGTTRTRST